MRVSDNWLAQGLTHLRCNGPWSNEPSKLADHLFGLFLSSDLYLCKGNEPALPDGLDGIHRVVICQAPVCLQVDEAVNVSQQMPSDPAAATAPPSQIIMDTPDKDNRNLPGKLNKLFLTDGHRQAVGLDLDGLLAQAQGQGHGYAPGCKVLVWGVTVRRGVLMLRRDSMRVLGGRVNRLAAYHQPQTQPQGQTQTQQQPAAAQSAQQPVPVPVPQQQLPPPPLPRASMPMPAPASSSSSSSSNSNSTSSYYQQQQLHPHPQQQLSSSSSVSMHMPMAAPAPAPPRPALFAPPQPPAYHFQYEEEEEEDEQDEQQIWEEEDEGFMEPAPTARTSTAATAAVSSAAVTVPPNPMIAMMRDQQQVQEQIHRPRSSNGSKGGDMIIIDEEEVVEVEDDERAEEEEEEVEEVEEEEEELYVQDLCSTSSGVQQEHKEEVPTSTSCPGLSRLVDVTNTPEEVHTVRGFACKLYRYREVEGEAEEVVLGLDDGHCPRPVTVAPSLANGFLASCTSEGVRAAGEAGRRARMLAFQQFSGIFLARSISSTSSGVGVSQGSSTASSASSGTPEVVLVDALALHGMEACDGPALLAVCRDMLTIYGTELLQS